VKDNVYNKLRVFDGSLKDLNTKVEDTQKSFHEHAITVNEALDKEFNRIEKVTLKFEEVMNDNIKQQNERMNIFDENNR